VGGGEAESQATRTASGRQTIEAVGFPLMLTAGPDDKGSLVAISDVAGRA